jgi:hypothetical protein
MKPTIIISEAYETCAVENFPTYQIPFETFDSVPSEERESLQFQASNDESAFFFSDYSDYTTTWSQNRITYRLHVIIDNEDNDENAIVDKMYKQNYDMSQPIATFNASQDQVHLKIVLHDKTILKSHSFNISNGIQSSKIKSKDNLVFTHYGALKIVNYSPELRVFAMTSSNDLQQHIQRNQECSRNGVYNVTGCSPGLYIDNKYGSFFDYNLHSQYIVGDVYILDTEILLNDLIYKTIDYLNKIYHF